MEHFDYSGGTNSEENSEDDTDEEGDEEDSQAKDEGTRMTKMMALMKPMKMRRIMTKVMMIARMNLYELRRRNIDHWLIYSYVHDMYRIVLIFVLREVWIKCIEENKVCWKQWSLRMFLFKLTM